MAAGHSKTPEEGVSGPVDWEAEVSPGLTLKEVDMEDGEYWKAVEAETDESNTVQPRSKRASVASSSSSQSRGGDTDNSAADSGSPDRQRKRKAGEPDEDPMEDMSDVETLQMVNEFNADLTSTPLYRWSPMEFGAIEAQSFLG